MTSIFSLLGDEPVAERIGSLRELNSLNLIVLDFAPESDPAEWVYEGASRLVRHFRAQSESGAFTRNRQLVIATFASPSTDEQIVHRAATVQSLRGIIQSVTREFAHRLEPLNFVAVDRDALDKLTSTLDYLDAPDGGYTAGFTFDLEQEKSA
ncbi:hypothetical protein [Arthrobacter sp. M4]|uniref:hypothetical protein n=1 Tax=Arthrobacter sp. M4 TaxID=218160 RepID=UPI001CDD6DB6|nr:hypothetical protein [Arthrobacter sp. M4]MCA4132537.1 hypothetical protein [Arthrobacter sp. M4]